MTKQRKKTLTDIAQSTHKTLLSLLTMTALFLGGISLFVLNNMALRGYAFQKEAEKREKLLDDISIIETKIAGVESRFTLKKSNRIKNMVFRQGNRFMVIEPTIKTAQIPSEHTNF
ncbi:hypothetical protein CSB37_01355 [bacterium DOLZORAL124_38_8]|nr:MAG: hypothetical protein CSB37_01355 [bacterium DOLZORAL124_38_8]